MSYEEAVCQATIAIYCGKQLGNPQAALDLGITIADLLKNNGWLEEEENGSTDSDKGEQGSPELPGEPSASRWSS